jgi:putative transposase
MDVRHTRHTAYQIIYHLVWCPKYRRPVLTVAYIARLVVLIHEIVPELGGEIIELVVRPDHVHLSGHFPPTLAPHQIMARIKGKTSHTLRQEVPSLRSRLPSLWTSAYYNYIGTAGSVSSETIRKYIEAQKGT